MSWAVRVVRNRYVDSVRLMRVAKELRAHGRAEVAMGTPANLETLAALGVTCDAGPTDVVIAVEGDESTLDAAERELAAPPARSDGPVAEPPRSLGAATRSLTDANVALISIPGEYAALEAHRALTAGLHVFLFSDHVSEADEVELKRRGAELGLLVMGPGCGTAMLGDVGLGFANVVRSGSVGIVAAAGTGAQEAASLLDGAGVGVSQIVGVGGRDLSSAVGGIMFGEAMRMLAADDGTETLLLVSKPPAREVVAAARRGRRRRQARRGGVRRLGRRRGAVRDPPDARRGRVRGRRSARRPTVGRARGRGRRASAPADGCSASTRAARSRTRRSRCSSPSSARSAATPATATATGTRSSTSARRSTRRAARTRWSTSRCGSGCSRTRRSDDGLGCVLLDVVIGHGSHADPAGGLADALRPLADRMPVIAHVCGTDGDPQDASRQERTLRDAGVIVAPTNAAAARLAAGRWRALRVAMLTYSVKPRGGVVHALEVSEALARRGHAVELMALARPGEGLFRETPLPLRIVRHTPADAPFDVRIEAMLEAYAEGLRPLLAHGRYDIVHAQDCLSANAALALRDEGVIDHVIRTVHHVDDFTSPSLIECQDRSIIGPRPRAVRVGAVGRAAASRVRRGRGARAQRRRHAIASGRRATPPSAPTPAASPGSRTAWSC